MTMIRRFLSIHGDGGHLPPHGDAQITTLLKLFPSTVKLSIFWARRLSQTVHALEFSESLHEFPNLGSLYLHISASSDEETQRTYMPSRRGSLTCDFDFEWVMEELQMILRHLPFSNLTELEVDIAESMDHWRMGHRMHSMRLALDSMCLPQLQEFTFRASMIVFPPLIEIFIWVSTS
jgi:hypothetical protein